MVTFKANNTHRVGTSPYDTYWYRYEYQTTNNGFCDENGSFIGMGPNILLELYEYPVLNETPKSVTIRGPDTKPKLIHKNWNRKFAWATIPEARLSFIKRKWAEQDILRRRMDRVTEALNAACTHWGHHEFKIPTIKLITEIYGVENLRLPLEDD